MYVAVDAVQLLAQGHSPVLPSHVIAEQAAQRHYGIRYPGLPAYFRHHAYALQSIVEEVAVYLALQCVELRPGRGEAALDVLVHQFLSPVQHAVEGVSQGVKLVPASAALGYADGQVAALYPEHVILQR